MVRWFWKRWVWVALAGSALAVGSGELAQVPGKSAATDSSATGAKDGPLPSDTITLKSPGGPDRKMKVVKSTPRPDGSVEIVVKDSASGETFTLVEPAPGKAPLAPPAANSKAGDSQVAPASDRRLFGGNKTTPPPPAHEPLSSPSAGPTPMPATGIPPAEPTKRPGLVSRLFGKKPPAGPAMPA